VKLFRIVKRGTNPDAFEPPPTSGKRPTVPRMERAHQRVSKRNGSKAALSDCADSREERDDIKRLAAKARDSFFLYR
jgi:hypothetical protein